MSSTLQTTQHVHDMYHRIHNIDLIFPHNLQFFVKVKCVILIHSLEMSKCPIEPYEKINSHRDV